MRPKTPKPRADFHIHLHCRGRIRKTAGVYRCKKCGMTGKQIVIEVATNPAQVEFEPDDEK